MTTPSSTASYEDKFRILFEILSHPNNNREEIPIALASAKAALAFRLRWYSFLKTLNNENESLEMRGLRNRAPELKRLAEKGREAIARSRKYKAVLIDSSVIFVLRETLDDETTKELMDILGNLSFSEGSLAEEIEDSSKTFEKALEQSLTELDVPEPHYALEPEPSPAEAIKPPITGITISALITNTKERLINGSKDNFSLPFSNELEAQGFVNKWAAFKLFHSDLPNHSITQTKNVIQFARESILNII